ncbi:hypothetical protein ACS0TY_026497 [Phlomoides rotata]
MGSNMEKAGKQSERTNTFWTVCTTCHVQYEYLNKYVNKRLCCKNCRSVFVAVDSGLVPPQGSAFPYNTSQLLSGD